MSWPASIASSSSLGLTRTWLTFWRFVPIAKGETICFLRPSASSGSGSLQCTGYASE
ncbi:hypothetical protein PF005_g19882 [Phytophthora fragariae]|uniref:Uncharacterized protein n=1 Tax=Phytophthora fragariae TaxID=53985 RepID=A0A6A3WW05_9STRA|nr:hypothetical protein PF003_g20415 [Phytophthora fragariae]KAE8928847.1 hypothetical protein PF009_g21025 [Phytophthora fragariae]KAE9088997.1 hypothetical protein PF007_g19765 [Phytophthora fragariae]KAE9188855.1 hypothetical protein PF005_g19882 [Phytophthora fragariae]KAE9285957.1 hypothetical protein PF001_g21667 [Phytophthora fragariae]